MRANRRYRATGARVRTLGAPRSFLWLLLLCGGVGAHASVTVLLEEPYGDLGVVDPAGHVAIYLDHVCADSPVKLRTCQPGELGAVISRYDGIGHIDWMAIPLVPYLYAVDRPEDIPVAVKRADITRLREIYRRNHLQAFAPDEPDGSAPPGNWYELAGAAFDRSIYGFEVNSAAEQDAKLIAMFNAHKNKDDYNGAFRNCADFARTIVNFYYPHAVRRNYVADFGLTSPKQVARGLTHYAGKHPEIGLQAFLIAQISGDAPRGSAPQGLAEGILKRFGVPLLVVSPVTTAVIAAAYVGQGRFSAPKNAPVLNLRPDLLMEGAMNWGIAPPASSEAGLVATAAARVPDTRVPGPRVPGSQAAAWREAAVAPAPAGLHGAALPSGGRLIHSTYPSEPPK